MGWLVFIVGLVLFLGVHSVRIAAPEWRMRFIGDHGDRTWRGVYSIVAIAGFVLLVWGYGMARQTAPVLYVTNFSMVYVTALLMVFAFVILASFHMPAGRIKATLKHPMLVAIKIWAAAHLLVNGDVASIVLFGSFLVWAVVDRVSEKQRFKAGLTRNPAFVSYRFDGIALVVGIVLYGLFVWKLHDWLIAPLPF